MPGAYIPIRVRRRLAVAALLVIVASISPAVEIGEDAPKFANPNLSGTYISHSTAVGKRWVIINFFATWCVPCKEELPQLETLQQDAGSKSLQVIVFATDKEKDKVKEYFNQHPTNLTVLLDPYQVAYQRYNSPEDGIPTIFLVNPEGKIVMKHVGYDPAFIEAIRGKILGAE